LTEHFEPNRNFVLFKFFHNTTKVIIKPFINEIVEVACPDLAVALVESNGGRGPVARLQPPAVGHQGVAQGILG
jgi:hypothetical protein